MYSKHKSTLSLICIVSNNAYYSFFDINSDKPKNPLIKSIVLGSSGLNTSSGTLMGTLFRIREYL